jgi:ribosomal protein S18 acetylase RimI-like enzyme
MEKYQITYREAIPEDAYEITLLRKIWFTTYVNKEEGITKEDIESSHNSRTIEEETARRAERIENNKESKIWVAKNQDKVVGFVEVQKKEKRNRIGAFYILDEYQHKGIGTELMKKALGWLGTKKDIFCEVATYNKGAIAFYKKFGFEDNGATTNDVAKLPSGKIIPEIEMVLKNTL